MCAIIREIRAIRVRLNYVCFMVLDYLSTILQSYEKFPNYANYFAIIFANNCKKRKRYNQWLHPCLLFIKQAIHSSELYGTEAAHYIVKLTLYQILLPLASLGNTTLVFSHE